MCIRDRHDHDENNEEEEENEEYEENSQDDENYDENEEYDRDEEEQLYTNTKTTKLSNPTSNQRKTSNPPKINTKQETVEVKQELKRSTRQTKQPTRLSPKMQGKSYLQQKSYADAVKTEYKHTEINYNMTCAQIAARAIGHFNKVHQQARVNGTSFLETYSLTKRLNLVRRGSRQQ